MVCRHKRHPNSQTRSQYHQHTLPTMRTSRCVDVSPQKILKGLQGSKVNPKLQKIREARLELLYFIHRLSYRRKEGAESLSVPDSVVHLKGARPRAQPADSSLSSPAIRGLTYSVLVPAPLRAAFMRNEALSGRHVRGGPFAQLLGTRRPPFLWAGLRADPRLMSRRWTLALPTAPFSW